MMIFWKFYIVPDFSSQRNFIKVIKTKNKKVISEMIH